jgi:TolB-like protein
LRSIAVAVLPFEPATGDPQEDALADSLTAAVVAALGGREELDVLGRDTASRYKGQGVDLLTLRAELGVRYVLDGKLGSRDGRVRVAAQLIDTTDGSHLWVETLERPAGEGREIADGVAVRVLRTLVPSARTRPPPPHGR